MAELDLSAAVEAALDAAHEVLEECIHPAGPFTANDVFSATRYAVRAAAPIIERAVREQHRRLMRSWYRSVLADGTLWCESSNMAEVIHRSSGHVDARFERHDTYELTDGWRPWLPEVTDA